MAIQKDAFHQASATEAFLRRVFEPEVSGIDIGDLSFHDYKTTLQETAQSLGLPLPGRWRARHPAAHRCP